MSPAFPDRSVPLSTATISGGSDPQLDAICRTAATLLGVRYAFVSQLDSEYQWYIGGNGISLGRVPRAETFCTNLRQDGQHEPLIVLDAQRDERFADLPFVRSSPHIRFYAGVPIVVGRAGVGGTICVADVAPRKRFGTNDVRRLLDLALFVEAILTTRVVTPREGRDLGTEPDTPD